MLEGRPHGSGKMTGLNGDFQDGLFDCGSVNGTHIHIHTHRHIHTERHRQTDRQTDRQTHAHTHTRTHIHTYTSGIADL